MVLETCPSQKSYHIRRFQSLHIRGPTLIITCEQCSTNGISDGTVSMSPSAHSAPLPKRMARIQFITLCWTLFLGGWNDGSTGPLLPRIQEVYHVSLSKLIQT